MRNRIRRNTGRTWILAAGILLVLWCSTGLGKQGRTVYAAEQAFDIDAEVLPSGKDTYDVQVTVGNRGADWEGTARLQVNNSYGDIYESAYDTVLSLPQDSTKQFVVRVPKDSVEDVSEVVAVMLLDKKSKKAVVKDFRRLLSDGANALTMGILSDDYLALTYLDMGGEEIYYDGSGYPVKLQELDQDSLDGALDTLNFLVIDHYNTSVLADDVLRHVERWMEDGGVLIVGTGTYAEDTLGGLDYLEVQSLGVDEPEENADLPGEDTALDDVDLSLLATARLRGRAGMYDKRRSSQALVCSWGDGAVGILPYALSELGRLDASAAFSQQLLYDVSNMANAHYGRNGSAYSSGNSYIFGRLIKLFGNSSTRLQFGMLKLIVVLYVIFVGPVLYLILRFARKRELYWVAVPVTTLFGILLVYLAGRGFEVVNTRVFSVTVQNLADKESTTYLHCYDARHKEWDLQMAEDYAYVGPMTGVYYYSNNDEEGGYYHHVSKEGDRIRFGIRPDAGFEDCYFLAGSREAVDGSILSDLSYAGQVAYSNKIGVDKSVTGINGTITNATEWDFEYVAIVYYDTLFVYGSLPAGETFELSSGKMIYNNIGSSRNARDAYLYDFDWEKNDIDAISALGMAVASAYSEDDADRTIVAGVVRDWDKAVDDNCNETSFGCLYTIQ